MAWAKVGLTFEFARQERGTENPGAWLRLRGPQSEAVLTVWRSGDVQLDWGVDTDVHSRHYSVSSGNELKRCVDDLEAVVSRRP